MELRSYQVRAIQKAREEYRKGSRDILLVAPTGAGKTIVGSTIAQGARSKGSQVLWIAHREELVAQARAKLPPDVHVATIQQLLASNKLPEASVLVLDEAHHYVASKWNTVAEHYRGALRIGLTATPQRGDGSGLGDIFTSMVVVATYSELISQGHIVGCDVIAPPDRGSSIAMSPEDAVRTYAWDRQSIVFTSTVPEAHRVASLIDGAIAIEGNTDKGTRLDAIEGFRQGKVRHLVNVYVLTEGFDAPSASVCILARGCTVEAAYVQMVGRVLRTWPGKERALLVDLAGVCHEFGFPTDDREHELTKGKKKKPKIPPLWACPNCKRMFRARPPDKRCKACGAEIPTPKAIETKERQLARKEAIQRSSSATKEAYWRTLQAQAQAKGYKPGWAWYRFKERYGHPPRYGA